MINFKPIEPIDMKLYVDYTNKDAFPTAFKPANTLGMPFLLGAEDIHDRWTVKQDAINYQDQEYWGLAGKITFDLPKDMTLTSITSYRNREFKYLLDLDGTELSDGAKPAIPITKR